MLRRAKQKQQKPPQNVRLYHGFLLQQHQTHVVRLRLLGVEEKRHRIELICTSSQSSPVLFPCISAQNKINEEAEQMINTYHFWLSIAPSILQLSLCSGTFRPTTCNASPIPKTVPLSTPYSQPLPPLQPDSTHILPWSNKKKDGALFRSLSKICISPSHFLSIMLSFVKMAHLDVPATKRF